VAPQIEVISGVRSWRLELQADRSTVGKAPENDVPLADDTTASHLHAVLERFPAGWCVSDLGSSNGTWVNACDTSESPECEGSSGHIGRTVGPSFS